LANLNQKGSAVVGFVMATPLILLLATAGMQLTWLLILQNQINQAADLGARTISLADQKNSPENTIRQYLSNAPIKNDNFEVKIKMTTYQNQVIQSVEINLPVKIILGPRVNLKAISYVS
jgi:Flp pilus assembly protein TadG